MFEDPSGFIEATPTGRLIGIDAGTKTLGLALSDVTRSIATPLETVKRRKFSIDVVHLQELASEHQIGGWVLGLPLNLDGSDGPRVQATRAFARNLTQHSPLPLLYWDERLSTVAAERVLLDADTSRQRRRDVIDKVAASVILQGALDRLRNL
ncbi:MAG: Holliday junction resolvase RuvX [Alphaproteobacteria bacterium]|nr:Holliday junction resolvase RuvX [Alphaproteobacteria bacterium]